MNRIFDKTSSIIFLAIGIFFILESDNIANSAYGSEVGPNVFPMGLGIILVLLSLRLLYESFRFPEENKKTTYQYKKFAIIFAAAILYVVLFEVIGYVLSTFLFLLVSFQAMERGKWIPSIITALGFSGIVYYLYVYVLQGTLPGFPIG